MEKYKSEEVIESLTAKIYPTDKRVPECVCYIRLTSGHVFISEDNYDGTYEDTYRLGDAIEYDGNPIEVSDVTFDPMSGKPIASYVLTDMFEMEHWTPAIP